MAAENPRNRRDVPQSLEELVELIGAEAAMRFAVRYGGTRVYVPRKPQTRHKLVAMVGMAAAEAMAARLGGDRIEVPRAHRLRSARARILRSQGSAAEVALQVGCTERWVRAVRRQAQPEADDRQADLIALLEG